MQNPFRITLALSVLLLLGAVGSASAINSIWTNANGGNWSTSWDNNYPKVGGDSAVISNATWTSGTQWPILINVADVNGTDLTVQDVAGPGFDLQINNNATFNNVTFFQDGGGSGRGRFSLGGNTLTMTNFNGFGWLTDFNMGGGTIVMKGNGSGVTTFGFGAGGEISTGGTMDFSDPTTVNFIATSVAGSFESRDSTWRVGNAAADQVWVVTNNPSPGNPIVMTQRTHSNPMNFIKIGSNLVDMTGIHIHRDSLGGGFDANQNLGRLFTDASGGQAGGTVKITAYTLPRIKNGSANYVQVDTVGANLTIGSGTGSGFIIQDYNLAADDDVTSLRMLSNNTLRVQASSGIVIRDDYNNAAATDGRLGIHFAGATLDSDSDLKLIGPRTFLNDGSNSNSRIYVGGNVQVQSRNATGFASLNSPPVGGADYDNFDLRATRLTLDGGVAQSLDWKTSAPRLTETNLAVGDFSLANFSLGTLYVSNSSAVTYTTNSALFLMNNLFIDGGSTLTMQWEDQIHILDTDLSETNRIAGYLGTRLLNTQMFTTEGVGITLQAIPEPNALAATLIGFGALLAARRRRNSSNP